MTLHKLTKVMKTEQCVFDVERACVEGPVLKVI